MLQMDETVLSRIVNGFREPNSHLRDRIAHLLQSDPEWLFEEAEITPLGGGNGREQAPSAKV